MTVHPHEHDRASGRRVLVRIVRAIVSVQRDSQNSVPVSLGLEWPLLAF